MHSSCLGSAPLLLRSVTKAAEHRWSPRPTETWLPSCFTLPHPCTLRQGKHRDAPTKTGAKPSDPAVASARSRSQGHLPPGSSRGYFFSGSHLFLKGYWFCLNSYYLAADFTQMSRLRVRGTNYFLAVCQKRDGLKRLPPVCLLSRLCLKPGEPGGFF